MTARTVGIAMPENRTAGSTVAVARLVGAALLLQFAIFLVALVVLGSAINWPASLGEPAAVVLPLIAQQAGAVAAGYFSYFVSALLLVPIALLVPTALAEETRPLLRVAAFIGATAGVLKLFGIARWLVLMPSLASAYIDPSASAATRDTAAMLYDAFNRYAGGIGENLGVMLFSGLWTILVGVALMRSARLPRWLGWAGVVAGATLLVGLVELFGIDAGAIYLTGSGVVWQLWMIAFGVTLLRARAA